MLIRRFLLLIIGALAACACTVFAAQKEPVVQLTEVGQKLEKQYQARLTALREEIRTAVQGVGEKERLAYKNAREAQSRAEADLADALKACVPLNEAKRLVAHAKDKWIGGAEKKIKHAEDVLKQSKTEPEREAARTELEKWLKNLAEGHQALKERQAALDALLKDPDEAQLQKQLETATSALAAAKEQTKLAVKKSGVLSIVESDKLDAKLAKFAVLSEATPRGLAVFAQQDAENAGLIDKLLADDDLMKQMMVAGGADDGKYGEAMKIYTDIQQASKRVHDPGILKRLALGTSLEMVVPYHQSYQTYLSSDTKPVDPVERYMHYEKAYLAGELDPAFEGMSVWECRWITDEPASNEELTWLRSMLSNYRPDLKRYPDPRWYYTRFIKTDVLYTRPKWDDSLPVSHLQEAVDKGGICHIRGWISRSLARSFGIPALRVEQGSEIK